jgi:hypothetical protein
MFGIASAVALPPEVREIIVPSFVSPSRGLGNER